MSLTALIFLILAALAAGLTWVVLVDRVHTFATVAISFFVFGLVGALLPALIGG